MVALLRYIILFVLVFWMNSCGMGQPEEILKKINGTSLVNPPRPIELKDLEAIKRINSDWVAVIPFGFSRQNEPKVYFNHERQWWGERVEGTRELILMSQQCGFKVMLKPHVWMRGGWIGDFDLQNEEDWKEWERSYEDYILTYAALCEELKVPILCIGTELKKAAMKRPVYWRSLIQKIRLVYNGKLTYAANWDSYHQIEFWDDLDFIGVDAYFPLVHTPDPKAEEIEEAWRSVKADLKSLSIKFDRPILFAEYGYQSTNGAAGNHWEVEKSPENLNMELQAIAYDCMFRMVWNEEWFAGGFLWKWHLREDAGGEYDAHFTPQGKPAEKVIAKWYGGY